jgi:phage shock protein A
MEIKKANWTTDGDSYQIQMQLTKVDKDNRLVSGWATLDNPDLQDDIVLATASEKAFQKFRGNIREMHQPIAAGRLVSYNPDTFYDAKTQKTYNGIFVTAYVSKGAQSTWEKVLDGTLSAFSIKGPILDSEMQFSKDRSKPLRVIKDYELEELSLVDSGGNQLANVMSFMKSSDGEVTVTGMVAETKVQNVFWCASDEIAKTSTDESSMCANCDTEMKNIGWFESGNEQAEKVAKVVDKYLNGTTTQTQEDPATVEGGAKMADDVKKDVTDSTDEGKTEVEKADSTVEEVKTGEVQKAEKVEEVKTEDQPNVVKMLEDLKDALTKGLNDNKTATVEAVDSRVAEVTKSLSETVDALKQQVTELAEKFNGVKSELGDVEKRVGSVEDATAVRKSGDLGGSKESESLEKKDSGLWSGSFLPVS